MDRLNKLIDASQISSQISSCQLRQIVSLVDYARDCWQLLPRDISSFDDLSNLDAYSLGFVKAVLHMMSIFGIDERFVKE